MRFDVEVHDDGTVTVEGDRLGPTLSAPQLALGLAEDLWPGLVAEVLVKETPATASSQVVEALGPTRTRITDPADAIQTVITLAGDDAEFRRSTDALLVDNLALAEVCAGLGVWLSHLLRRSRTAPAIASTDGAATIGAEQRSVRWSVAAGTDA